MATIYHRWLDRRPLAGPPGSKPLPVTAHRIGPCLDQPSVTAAPRDCAVSIRSQRKTPFAGPREGPEDGWTDHPVIVGLAEEIVRRHGEGGVGTSVDAFHTTVLHGLEARWSSPRDIYGICAGHRSARLLAGWLRLGSGRSACWVTRVRSVVAVHEEFESVCGGRTRCCRRIPAGAVQVGGEFHRSEAEV